ncbi:MAG: DNA polymerase III subunit epsilon [Pseudomonadota bacterium]
MTRQIVLDTETTGLDPGQGHRIIEIGGVELIDRRLTGAHFHEYLQPDREVDVGAIEVHGITNEFLMDKPRFETVAEKFLQFVKGAELVIHNAAFDIGFIDAELARMERSSVLDNCDVLDTLALAREFYPGQRNSLDALCKRLEIDNSQRTLHGALLDAEILADVYLQMTGGQTSLSLDIDSEASVARDDSDGGSLEITATRIIAANDEELALHRQWVDKLKEQGGPSTMWGEPTH